MDRGAAMCGTVSMIFLGMAILFTFLKGKAAILIAGFNTMPKEQREQYDMLIGHRCKREDGLSRIFVTNVLGMVIRLCFRVKVTDANTPFRLMRAEVLAEQIGLIPKGFNLSNVLISVIYAKKNLRVKYIPITFRPRQGGKNSINLKKIFGIGCQAVHDFREINRTLQKN